MNANLGVATARRVCRCPDMPGGCAIPIRWGTLMLRRTCFVRSYGRRPLRNQARTLREGAWQPG
ncbi:hypothetical protein ADL19_04845 [Streptomyces purpurogeneiscleroticus]|nr:hypothetical protein ADL19_04845 [Streptomyces purpurogeneiscleroticus]